MGLPDTARLSRQTAAAVVHKHGHVWQKHALVRGAFYYKSQEHTRIRAFSPNKQRQHSLHWPGKGARAAPCALWGLPFYRVRGSSQRNRVSLVCKAILTSKATSKYAGTSHHGFGCPTSWRRVARLPLCVTHTTVLSAHITIGGAGIKVSYLSPVVFKCYLSPPLPLVTKLKRNPDACNCC